jgi:hypothetical protein
MALSKPKSKGQRKGREDIPAKQNIRVEMPILNLTAEEVVVKRVIDHIQTEGFTPVEDFNVFITHGQNLQVWLDKEFKEPKWEMKEIGLTIKSILQQEFDFNFELINWSHRSIGFMLEVDQCNHAEYLRQQGF